MENDDRKSPARNPQFLPAPGQATTAAAGSNRTAGQRPRGNDWYRLAPRPKAGGGDRVPSEPDGLPSEPDGIPSASDGVLRERDSVPREGDG